MNMSKKKKRFKFVCIMDEPVTLYWKKDIYGGTIYTEDGSPVKAIYRKEDNGYHRIYEQRSKWTVVYPEWDFHDDIIRKIILEPAKKSSNYSF